MNTGSSILVVKDSTELIQEFLKDSVGIYINEKISGLTAGTDDELIKSGIVDTLNMLLDGLVRPRELFDEHNRPIAGVKQRDNQVEIYAAAMILKENLPEYVEVMDKLIYPATVAIAEKDGINLERNVELFVPIMQKVGRESIFTKTSEEIAKKLYESGSKLSIQGAQRSSFLNRVYVLLEKGQLNSMANPLKDMDARFKQKALEKKLDKLGRSNVAAILKQGKILFHGVDTSSQSAQEVPSYFLQGGVEVGSPKK